MKVRPYSLVGLILVFLILGLVFLFYSRELLGTDYLKDFVLQQLEASIGRKIEVDRVKFVVFPGIRLELSHVAIYGHQDPSHVVFTARQMDVALRLIPLLRKQVVAKRIALDEPRLELRRMRDGQWNVLAGLQTSLSETADLESFARLLLIREATLRNGHITLVDEAREDGTRTAELESVELSLQVHPAQGRGELRVAASLPEEQSVTTIGLMGILTSLNRSSTLTTEDVLSDQPAFQFDGDLEATDLNLKALADFFGPRPVPEALHGTATVRSRVHIVPGVSGYDVVLSDFVAHADQLEVTGRANLSGLMTEQPTFAITFSSPSVDVRNLFHRIPPRWIHPELEGLLTDHQLDGTITVRSATLTGSSTTNPQYSVTGEFRAENVHALIGADRVPADDIAATILVETGRIRVSGMTGRYGAIQIADGKATVSFLDTGPWLEMEIGGDMAAHELVQLLAKALHSKRLSAILAKSHTIEGQALPTFRIVGPLNKPDGLTFAGGEIVARKISLSNPSLPQRVTGIEGRFLFSQDGAQLDQVTARLGDVDLKLNGQITGGTSSTFRDFRLKAHGSADQIRQWLPISSLPHGLIVGPVSTTVALSGPTDAPHLQGDVELTQATMTVPNLGEKPSGSPAGLEFEGNVSRTGGATLTRLEVVIPPLRVPVKGLMRLGEQFRIDAELATGVVSLSSLPEWINKGGIEAGNLEVSLDLKGTDLKWTTWRTSGWIALTNGLMVAKGVDGQIQNLYLRLKFARNLAEIKQLSFRIKDSDVVMAATVRDWATRPVVAAKIESSQMDIDLLIPKGTRSPIREFLETLAATSRVTATANITKGVYKHLRFGALSGRIAIQDGQVHVDGLSGQVGTGQMGGELLVKLPRQAPADASVAVRMTGIPVEAMLPLLGTTDQSITGDLKMTGTLQGHGRNPHGLSPTLNGKAEIVAENGRIFKNDKRPIWKILSILNLPAVLRGKINLEKDGLQYSKLTTSVTIQNGVLSTQNLILDSPVVKITAAGTYDAPTDQLDMVWAVSPFGSYAQFVKAIPLFGRLFAGERHGIATALFQVKGSMEDPDVLYLPMKSFTNGLGGLAQLAFDVLKNSLTLPGDLLIPKDERQGFPEPVPIPSPASNSNKFGLSAPTPTSP